jgi:transposase-like protein
MIASRKFWLWRAVDEEGEVLTCRRNDGAARLPQ